MKHILILVLSAVLTATAQLNSGLGTIPQGGNDNPVTVRFTSNATDDTLQITISLAMEKEVYLYADSSHFFNIEATHTQGLGDPVVQKPEAFNHTNFDGTIVTVFKNGQFFRITAQIEKKEWLFSGRFQFQACNNVTCFMPTTKTFTISSERPEAVTNEPTGQLPATPLYVDGDPKTEQNWKLYSDKFRQAGKYGGFLSAEKFLKFLESPEQNLAENRFAGKHILVIIAIIILGGLALNLTPCVLPLVPITLAVIGAGTQAKSRWRGFIIGSFYGLGISIAYGALGLIVVLSGGTFGALNSSPWFNLGITVLFLVLALAMFDLLYIDFTRFRSVVGSSKKSRGRIFFALFMGLITALMAGACVAPAVISVVVYSTSLYNNGNSAGLLLPFLLGLGMALPWPFTGAGLSFLPKPGKWMEWIRNGFGVIILVMAIYYGYTTFSLFKQNSAISKSVTLQNENSDLPWIASIEEGLATALRENKPVFIDFWATWCKNCKAMDATTFKDEEVKIKMRQFVLIKYQAENPAEEDTKKVLNYFGVIGLPSYVILEPK